MKRIRLTLLLSACLFLLPFTSLAFNNEIALAGLTEVKAVFDVNQGDPNKLLLRLQLVDKSWQQLSVKHIATTFILVFRGPASHYLTIDENDISILDMEIRKTIQEQIKLLHQRGVQLEQCAIAAQLLHLNPQKFMPEINVVENGYVSLIAYQNRDYAFIPMD